MLIRCLRSTIIEAVKLSQVDVLAAPMQHVERVSAISRTDSTDSPDCLPILLSTSVFLLFTFSVFDFLVFGSVR